MDVTRIDYKKLDLWIKKNQEKTFRDLLAEMPDFKCSHWSFTKRRNKVLGLRMTKSMYSDYRSSPDSSTERRSRSMYTSVFSMPVAELKKKDSLSAVNDVINLINHAFKLHLEPALIQLVGSDIQNFEIRRYNR